MEYHQKLDLQYDVAINVVCGCVASQHSQKQYDLCSFQRENDLLTADIYTLV